MKKIMYYFDEHLPNRLLSAMIFAFIFIATPKLLTDFYFHYLDQTQYISITQPMSIDKKTYKPCEPVIVTTRLTAKIDADVTSLTQLVLMKDDISTVRIGRVMESKTPVRALDPHSVSSAIPLPCDLEDGRYFWQGNASYFIRGYEHTISFVSDTFNVYKAGLSPSTIDAIKEATESAKNSK